jgi:hypothetical protein
VPLTKGENHVFHFSFGTSTDFFAWRHGFASTGGTVMPLEKGKTHFFVRGADLLLVEAWICYRERHDCASQKGEK